ncbi:MAG TPA: hypothetical protein HA223_05440 [Nanoarchaeota archaeon]|nr:hypothetical protein [Nanoarchaeota archaeon]
MSLTQKYGLKHEFLIGLEGVIQAYESERAEEARRKDISRERWNEFFSFFSWKSIPSFRISSGGAAIYESHRIRISAVVAGAIGVAALGGIGAYNAIQSQNNFSYNIPGIQLPFDSPSAQEEQKQSKKIGSSNAKIVYDRKDVTVPAPEQGEKKTEDVQYSPPAAQETYVDERPTKRQRQRPAKESNSDYGSPERASASGRSTTSSNYTSQPKEDSAPKLKYNPNIADEVTTKASEVNTSSSGGGDVEGVLYDPSTKGRTRGYGDYEKGGNGGKG